MKKKQKLLFSGLLLFFLTGMLCGQTKYSIRANGGVAHDFRYALGYYYSFEIGIPISKSLEIAPTFCHTSMLSNNYFSFDWASYNPQPSYGYSVNGPNNEYESRIEIGSISLLLFFKPFELLDKRQFKNHEIYIGTGISYSSYSQIFIKFKKISNDYYLDLFSVESNRDFNFNYLKLGYNYYFNNKFAGIVFALNGYHDEAVMNVGLQFGVVFNNK